MTAVGWTLDFTDKDMTHSGVSAKCGQGFNWFGWSSGTQVGIASATLKGSGAALLEFGNCWNEGEVNVYVGGIKIATAIANTPRKTVLFPFKNGPKLEVKDENGNAVVQIKSLKVICSKVYVRVSCLFTCVPLCASFSLMLDSIRNFMNSAPAFNCSYLRTILIFRPY